jgi:hypothetical protein
MTQKFFRTPAAVQRGFETVAFPLAGPISEGVPGAGFILLFALPCGHAVRVSKANFRKEGQERKQSNVSRFERKIRKLH